MQTDGFSPETGRKYNSTIDCIRKVLRTEGGGAFTRGLTPTLIRSVSPYFPCLLYLMVFIFEGHPLRTAQRSWALSLPAGGSTLDLNTRTHDENRI